MPRDSVIPVTAVLGEEELLVERRVDALIADAQAALGPGTSVEQVGASSLPDGFALGLATASLFGGGRVVVIRDAQELEAAGRAAVRDAATAGAADTVVILVAPGAGRLGKYFADLEAGGNTRLERLARLKPAERAQWVTREFAAYRRKADPSAVGALLDTVGTDLRELAGAVGKLHVAVPPPATITADHVAEFLARTAERRVFEFTDAVLSGRVDAALADLDALLAQGDDPLALLGMLAHQLRILLRTADHEGMSAPRAAEAMGGGVRDWQVERARRQLRRFGPDQVRRALARVADADAEVRASALPPRVLLELLVARFAAGGGARRQASPAGAGVGSGRPGDAGGSGGPAGGGIRQAGEIG